MIIRWQQKEVLESLRYRRVVHVTGARQTGKTTLVKMLDLAACRRYTMDDSALRNAAKEDPIAFSERPASGPMVIDEVQKVPELLDAIKMRVDADDAKGQYLLTGSSNLDFSKKVNDSLAGRLHSVRLRTLSLGEIAGREPGFLSNAFKRRFDESDVPLGKRDVIRLAFKGGYPECRDFPARPRKSWFADYLEHLLRKDIRDVTEIRKLDALREIALWLLAHSSKFFTIEELCGKSSIGKVTAESYLSALCALYVFDKIPAWSKTDYDRIGKRPKYFATDTGLMANLLGWDEETAFLDSDLSGKLVESWVYHELSALADAEGGYTISQYRDKNRREVDFIVENEKGDLLGVEVKAGANVGKDDFKHLKWFGENLAKVPYTGIVLYTGEHVQRFGEGYYAVPMSCLA
ncbi:MAG: ATP-binding protein [Kiritimatiellia bacterium]|nr:ATP-binding protein [Kiritimatiellia bacterium]